MVYSYTIVYPKPSVSDTLPDGSKRVTVYDYVNGCNRNISVPSEEADEFINARAKAMKKQIKYQEKLIGSLTILGSIIGSIFAFSKKVKGWQDKAFSIFMGCFGGVLAGCLAALFCIKQPETIDKEICHNFINTHVEARSGTA